jgi:hypothetical protein
MPRTTPTGARRWPTCGPSTMPSRSRRGRVDAPKWHAHRSVGRTRVPHRPHHTALPHALGAQCFTSLARDSASGPHGVPPLCACCVAARVRDAMPRPHCRAGTRSPHTAPAGALHHHHARTLYTTAHIVHPLRAARDADNTFATHCASGRIHGAHERLLSVRDSKPPPHRSLHRPHGAHCRVMLRLLHAVVTSHGCHRPRLPQCASTCTPRAHAARPRAATVAAARAQRRTAQCRIVVLAHGTAPLARHDARQPPLALTAAHAGAHAGIARVPHIAHRVPRLPHARHDALNAGAPPTHSCVNDCVVHRTSSCV